MRYLTLLAACAAFCAVGAAQGTLLAVYVTGTNLDEINSANGSTITSTPLTVSSGSVVGVSGMAQDPTTGTIYVAVRNTFTQTDIHLGTLNKDTGLITILGAFGEAVAGLQFNTAGTLYAVTGEMQSGTTTPESMFTVNKTNGALTPLHTLGNGDNGEALGFDPNSPTVMYHWSGLTTQVYETVNIATGSTSPITVSGLAANTTILCMAWDSNSSWFWTCTGASEYGYIRPNGTYVGLGSMAGLAKGMVVLPTIDPDVSNLALGTTMQGLNSTPVSFTLRGYNLFGNVVLNAPANVEISLSAASGYGPTLNVPPATSGQLSATTIYARIPGSAPVGMISAPLTLTTTGGDAASIALTGQVDPVATPAEMNVKNGLNSIADGGTDSVGTQAPGMVHTITYTIENNGNLDLLLNGVPIVAVGISANVISASVPTMPTSPVPGLSTVMFDLVYEVAGAGTFDITLSIDNNDADENPYNWTVSGDVLVTPPEIGVSRGATAVADGATDTLPTQQIANIGATYTISNSGGSALTVGTATISGESNCTVVISAQPASVVAVSGTTTLDLVITPTAVGAYSFSIAIPNDDSDENPYDINVDGNVTSPSGGNGGDDEDDDGGDDEGCSTGTGLGASWLALLAAISAGALALRARQSRE